MAKAFVCASYGFILLLAGLLANLGGHGTSLPMLVFSSPLSGIAELSPSGALGPLAILGAPLFWAAFGLMWARQAPRSRIMRAMLACHYCVAVLVVVARGIHRYDWEPVQSPVGAIIIASAVAAYAVGQFAIWRRLRLEALS